MPVKTKKTELPKPTADASGKMPPKNEEMEAAILGALMISKDIYGVVADLLRPQSFYNDKHRYIYEAIQTLSLQGQPTDYLSVSEQLRVMDKLKEAGDLPYLMELTTAIASTANILSYAENIALKATARDLISFAGEISTHAFDETQPIKETIENAEKGIFEITQRTYKNDVVAVGSLIENTLEKLQILSEQGDSISGIPTGWTELDKITSGWQKSDLIIVAGRPSMGKTAFVLSMAKNIAVDYRKPVAMFDLEMSNHQLINRLIMNICELEGEKLRSGGLLTASDWKKLETRLNSLKDAPFYLDDTSGLSIFELCSKARRLKREHDIQLLIVDYLQLLNAGSNFNNRNREQEIATISRMLKNLARELNIPVIALSQLNRDTEKREGTTGKIPQLSDLRESGAIEQDADIVCFIHRPEKYRIYEDEKGNNVRGLAQIVIAKHRNGKTGDVWLRFQQRYAKFQNLTDDYNEEDFIETGESLEMGESLETGVSFNASDFAPKTTYSNDQDDDKKDPF